MTHPNHQKATCKHMAPPLRRYVRDVAGDPHGRVREECPRCGYIFWEAKRELVEDEPVNRGE